MKTGRSYLLLVVCAALAVLCGCGNRSYVRDTGRTYVSYDRDYSYNDVGVVYFDWRIQKLHFFDPESGVMAPLCTRVNCTHRSEDCDAHMDPAKTAAIIGDSLYYVEGTMHDILIGRADPNGTNRRVLHTVKDVGLCSRAAFEDGHLIYAYYNQYDEHGEILPNWESWICLMDLETEKLEVIELPKQQYGGRVDQVTMADGVLYYCYFYMTEDMRNLNLSSDESGYYEWMKRRMLEVWKYDPATRENVCLRSWNGLQIAGIAIMGYGHYYTNIEGKGYLENLGTGEVFELELGIGEKEERPGCLYDEGVVIWGDGNFYRCRYGGDKIEKIGVYDTERYVYIECITKDWVYAKMLDEAKKPKLYYTSREQFFEGKPDWKLVPEPEV